MTSISEAEPKKHYYYRKKVRARSARDLFGTTSFLLQLWFIIYLLASYSYIVQMDETWASTNVNHFTF